MTTKKKIMEVIGGDFRCEGFKEEAQRWLLKIKALKNRTPEGEEVKLEDIEKLIIKLQKKYDCEMQWISLNIIKDDMPWYSVSIKNKHTNEYEKSIYGLTIYELYCKVALFLYACSRRKDG